MRASLAYLAGVATVVVAIATGLGGGLLLGDIMSPHGSKQAEATRLDQGASAVNGAAQPVPFVTATQSAGTVAEPQAPKQAGPPPSQQAQSQSQQAATQPAEPKQSPERDAPAQSAAAPQPAEPAARERSAPEDSFAKARDDESKRDARRADKERRKAERRQQRAEQRAERRKRQRGVDDRFDTGMQDTTQSWPPYYRQPAYGTGRVTLFDD